MELERRTFLVQFVGVESLVFYSTADGTDLVQDILRRQLSRSDEEIFGQEGSISIDDQGEFLTFEPTDTKNRILHLPIEHLAYSGALRRMKSNSTRDERTADQIFRRDFENVDLANRYPQLIVGPPIFVAIFHGFDKALSYTFVTQTSDDSCLLVMKLIRAFKYQEYQLFEKEQRLREQQQREKEKEREREGQGQSINEGDQQSSNEVILPSPSLLCDDGNVHSSLSRLIAIDPYSPSFSLLSNLPNSISSYPHENHSIEPILCNSTNSPLNCCEMRRCYLLPPPANLCLPSSTIFFDDFCPSTSIYYINDPSTNFHCYSL